MLIIQAVVVLKLIITWTALNCLKSSLIKFWYIPRERFLDPPQPPPPINFAHGSYMLDMVIIDPVAAALGPESVLTNLTRGRSARPPSPS